MESPRGRHWDQVSVNETFVSIGRTVKSGDVNLFAGLSGDFNGLHVNEEYAKAGPFGTRIAHGLLTLAISSGQIQRLGIFEENVLGFLGMDEVRFSRPVRFGDTVTTTVTIVGTRPTSKPGRGVVSQRVEVRNQHGDAVLTYNQALLVTSSK